MTVADLQNMEGFWVSDSQDVAPINKMCGTDFDSFFVLSNSPDGTAIVFGIEGIVPLLWKQVHRMVLE